MGGAHQPLPGGISWHAGARRCVAGRAAMTADGESGGLREALSGPPPGRSIAGCGAARFGGRGWPRGSSISVCSRSCGTSPTGIRGGSGSSRRISMRPCAFAGYAVYALFRTRSLWQVVAGARRHRARLHLPAARARTAWRGAWGRATRQAPAGARHAPPRRPDSALRAAPPCLATAHHAPLGGELPADDRNGPGALPRAVAGGDRRALRPSGVVYALRSARLRRAPVADSADRVADGPAEGDRPVANRPRDDP